MEGLGLECLLVAMTVTCALQQRHDKLRQLPPQVFIRVQRSIQRSMRSCRECRRCRPPPAETC